LAEPELIAIVDDDESMREALSALVTSLGLRASAFASAQEFLSQADHAATACLICDVQMPQMSGPQLYRRLLATGTVIPTILITAYPDEHTRMQALREGVSCYLPKPLHDEQLIACIERAIERRRS
jgi:FixJ family two-component response regulator